jgi:hypothetical protein
MEQPLGPRVTPTAAASFSTLAWMEDLEPWSKAMSMAEAHTTTQIRSRLATADWITPGHDDPQTTASPVRSSRGDRVRCLRGRGEPGSGWDNGAGRHGDREEERMRKASVTTARCGRGDGVMIVGLGGGGGGWEEKRGALGEETARGPSL